MKLVTRLLTVAITAPLLFGCFNFDFSGTAPESPEFASDTDPPGTTALATPTGEGTGAANGLPSIGSVVRSAAGDFAAVAEILGDDCNMNMEEDSFDIEDGVSADCDGNGVPDECECDLISGFSLDCSGNGVPGECEPDCNANERPDDCDIVDGLATDCDMNGVPDDCQSEDCEYLSVRRTCRCMQDELSLLVAAVEEDLRRGFGRELITMTAADACADALFDGTECSYGCLECMESVIAFVFDESRTSHARN